MEYATSSVIGAKGFVSKNADEGILLTAINAVANGKSYIQAELVTGLLEVRDITQTFTKKEKLLCFLSSRKAKLFSFFSAWPLPSL